MGIGDWGLGVGRRELSLALVLLCAALGGCGKKGPPLAPIVHVPAAVDKLSARRVGNDIYLTLTVPTQNIDSSTPADVSRIDIFGATSLTPPPATRIFEIATKIATIEVQPPPPPEGSAASPPAPRPGLPTQGATVTIHDALTPEALQPKALADTTARAGSRTTSATPTSTAAPPVPSFPRRYYVAIATSDRGRSGPPGRLLEVPLPPLPDPPAIPTLTQMDEDVVITWDPSGGVVGFLLEKPIADEIPPVDEAGVSASPTAPAPAGPTLYNVYREMGRAPEPGSESSAPLNAAPAEPINGSPLAALTFTDRAVQFGQERCYTIRAIRGTAPNLIVSEPSPRACITPIDTVAPAAPTDLSALAAEGVINLSWEPNGEPDLGGYLVLRGRAGDATLQPLTSSPVTDTRFADRDVMPGVRYVYVVRAVDRQRPPNVSEDSNRAEETAR